MLPKIEKILKKPAADYFFLGGAGGVPASFITTHSSHAILPFYLS
jgi:hypothetical protein